MVLSDLQGHNVYYGAEQSAALSLGSRGRLKEGLTLDIIQTEFFQRALIGGLLIGITAPLMGLFLVLRRLSMIGDTLAHVSIAGVALGFLIGIYPIGVGLLFALGAAFAIEKLRKAYKTYAELSIAIIMSGGVALASLLFTMGRGFNVNVTGYLFGSIYTLGNEDLVVIAVVTVVVLAAVVLHYKELFLLTFDEDAAAVNGLPVRYFNIMISILTALVISASIKIVGALLISALLTIPAACSLIIARSFKQTIITVVAVAELAVMSGLLIAGVWNLAPGGTIVMLLICMLMILLLVKRGFKI